MNVKYSVSVERAKEIMARPATIGPGDWYALANTVVSLSAAVAALQQACDDGDAEIALLARRLEAK